MKRKIFLIIACVCVMNLLLGCGSDEDPLEEDVTGVDPEIEIQQGKAEIYQTGDQWIVKWLVLDLIENNGGSHNASNVDYIAIGTNNQHTQESISRTEEIFALQNMEVDLPENGANPHLWHIKTINHTDTFNMSHTFYPNTDFDNITWYGVLVIQSPNDRRTVAYVAHDDYGQVWLNGKKIYDNPSPTGIEKGKLITISLNEGNNVLLFKCSETGGGDYVGLRFGQTDNDLKILPTLTEEFFGKIAQVDSNEEEKKTRKLSL